MLTLALLAALLPGASGAGECQRFLSEEHLAELLGAYTYLANPDTTRAAARAFFGALPDSFACYEAVFDDPGPLAESPAMEEVFPRLRAAIPVQSYIRKLVRLSVGATWRPDQIDHLKNAGRAALSDSPSVFVRELSALNASQEAGVWDFLFGGLDPRAEPLSDGLQKRICSLSARSCEASAAAYARALERRQRER